MKTKIEDLREQITRAAAVNEETTADLAEAIARIYELLKARLEARELEYELMEQVRNLNVKGNE